MTSQQGIFIHIPKAAGTSVRKTLSPLGIKRFHKHETALYIKEHAPEFFNSGPKIAWVRDPWKRAVSLWKYTHIINKQHQEANFKKWLFDSREVGPHLVDVKNSNRNPVSACTYLEDLDGNFLVDFIGTVENFKEDMAKLTTFLPDYWLHMGDPNWNIKKELEIYHLNKRDCSAKYRDFHDSETIEYIREVCSWEISRFNYKFDE